jgi:hypothetical protein
MGGIPKVASFGDHAQLLPIGQQTVFDSKPPKPGSGGAHGQIAFTKFIHPDLVDGSVTTRSTSVFMDKVLRQDEPQLRRLLLHMRDGEVDDADVELLVSRCLENLDLEERESFKHAIHLAPTWAKANEILVDYLTNDLTGPIAKVTARLTSSHTRNCCLKDCSLPVRTALCPGGKVMLLTNFVVEEGLFNGSVGDLKSIHYAHSSGPNADIPKGYAIVDFPQCTISEEKKLIPGMPRTCVPVPIIEVCCAKRCCGLETFPLRMSVSLTGHKAQGMTIADGELYENVVIHFPTNGRCNVTGLEMVMTSRVKSISNFCLGNRVSDLDKTYLKKIGKSPTNDQRRLFQQRVKSQYENVDRPRVLAEIAQLDSSGRQTYEGGCTFLLRWYRKTFWNWPDNRP